MDPAFDLVLRLAGTLLFGSTSLHKLRDVGAFRSALLGYDVLPRAALRSIAVSLPALELTTAGALLAGARLGCGSAALLLLLYAAAMAINLARGRRDLDCGCGGIAGGQRVSAGLVLRNLVLAAGAAAITQPPLARALGWIDAVSVAGLVAVLAVAWSASQRLAALPRLVPRELGARSGGR